MYAVLLSFFSGGKNVSSCCSGFCSSLKSCRRSLLVEDDANEKEEDKEAFRIERDSPKALLRPRLINDDNIDIFSFFFFEGENVFFFFFFSSVLLPFTFFSETNTTKLSMHGKDRSLLQPRMKTE